MRDFEKFILNLELIDVALILRQNLLVQDKHDFCCLKNGWRNSQFVIHKA